MKFKDKFALTDVALAYMMGRDPKADLGGNSTGFYQEFYGKCDAKKLEVAINCMIKRQPMFHTIVFADGTQAELEELPEYHLEIIDLTGSTEQEIENYFEMYREENSHKIFPLELWPMFQFTYFKLRDGYSKIVVIFDMVLVDRYSVDILFHELNAYYENPNAALPPLSHSYMEYIQLVQQERKLKYEEDKSYWSKVIEDMPLAPPIRLEAGNHSGNKFKTLQRRLDHETYVKIQDVLYGERIVPSVYLMYCYGKCLSRFSSAEALSVSMTMADRMPLGQIFSDVIGDFTKLILVDLHYESDSWRRECKELQTRIRLYMKHSAYNGMDVMKEISRREQLSGKAMFPFAYTSRLSSNAELTCVMGEVQYQISHTPQVALDCQIGEYDGEIDIRWDYLSGAFTTEFIESMYQYYLELIANECMDTSSHSGLPYDFYDKYNDTKKEIPSTTLQALFQKQAAKTPDLLAVSDREKTLTYQQLEEASNAIARYIEKRYGSGNTVMISGRRCTETVAFMLGVLKSGNAYVPYDEMYPKERIHTISDTCQVVLNLTTDMYADIVEQESIETYLVKGSPEDVAYIIFTSGSTGIPKGVVITQDAVCNTIQDMNCRFQITSEDNIIGISSFWFDLSVYDIFGSLSTGAHLVLAEKVDMAQIAQILNQYPITVWNTVPAIMELLVASNLEFKTDSLRHVLLSGDWIPIDLPSKVKQTFPNAEVCSLGGATEASIWSIYYPIDHVHKEWKSIPYGYPLANQTMYIMNKKNELCPIGVQGEICIGGRGVAKEYCENKTETEAHFIEHAKYGRLYKTGDYGYMSEDGYIVFVGRMDQQVKLHGYRIELGEIEVALYKHPNVEKALAVMIKNELGASMIGVYIICKDKSQYDEKEVLTFIATLLPDYMMPSVMVCLDAFPLTANGKIDRKALPVPTLEHTENEPPKTEMERLIATIWTEELGVAEVSRNDNFFYLGGDSLLALHVIGKIQQTSGIKVDISELFASPVLSEFCSLLENKQGDREEEVLPEMEKDTLHRNESFALTDIQRSYWIGARSLKYMSGVTTHAFCEVTCEEIDMDRLERAFNQVIEEQDMMRATIQEDGTQKILDQVPRYKIRVHYEETEQFDHEVEQLRQEMQHERFDASKWPLFRVEAVSSKKKTVLLVDLDNLIFDGFSVQLLFRHWNMYYQEELETKKYDISFRDYVITLEKIKKSKRYQADKEYWNEKVNTMYPAPELFTQMSPDTITSQTIQHIQTRLSATDWSFTKRTMQKTSCNTVRNVINGVCTNVSIMEQKTIIYNQCDAIQSFI